VSDVPGVHSVQVDELVRRYSTVYLSTVPDTGAQVRVTAPEARVADTVGAAGGVVTVSGAGVEHPATLHAETATTD
jgi:hypothetical protein